MTKEECIGLLKRYAKYDGMGIPNLAGCKDAMRMAAELLEGPSLPSNLDEAANNYSRDIRLGYPRVMDETDKYIYNAFKAGAEWMARPGAG